MALERKVTSSEEALALLDREVIHLDSQSAEKYCREGRGLGKSQRYGEAYFYMAVAARNFQRISDSQGIDISQLEHAVKAYQGAAGSAMFLGFYEAALRCRMRMCKLLDLLYNKTGNGKFLLDLVFTQSKVRISADYLGSVSEDTSSGSCQRSKIRSKKKDKKPDSSMGGKRGVRYFEDIVPDEEKRRKRQEAEEKKRRAGRLMLSDVDDAKLDETLNGNR